jgi:hypothetical protein
MPEPSGLCPHCGEPTAYQNPRYPDALCKTCCRKATDLQGRPVALNNESFSGGFVADHVDDGSPCEQVTRDGRVLIDGTTFLAHEAHMGGIVIQPLP